MGTPGEHSFQGYHAQPPGVFLQPLATRTQEHHHHGLPHQHQPLKRRRLDQPDFMGPPALQTPPQGPSIIDQEGMPPPAMPPKRPKAKFTPEEDKLLVDLKEHKQQLTWKQIAEFFPGRSSATLQVRYCTKLKSKTVVWTDEMVERLKRAIRDYDADKWRVVSGKVGNGFTPAACKDKVVELEAETSDEAKHSNDGLEEPGDPGEIAGPSDLDFG